MRADVAVIGAGAAGLTAALSLPETMQVAVFAKRSLRQCASAWAQGGLAAALDESDSADAHAEDTIRTGDGLCSPDAVRAIVDDAPAAVQWLEDIGVRFNRESDAFALAREGGHSARRIVHVDDATGGAIIEALASRAAERPNIRIFEGALAVNLHAEDGACGGFYALDLAGGDIQAVSAHATLLACGGAGKVYLYSTTPPDATGDGIAMAFRAGCPIMNMEFVQFHPTCLYHPHAPAFLITEAMRGEGAQLVNAAGERFLPDGISELSPRDIVARTIDAEMKRSGADCVYLDLSAHPSAFWRQRFPTVIRRCEDLGVDIRRIPVVPAAHYCCGGIQADLDGRTRLRGLYAAGETACIGLHGANRLASNSLLECVTAARRAAGAIAADLPAHRTPPPPWDERRIRPAAENVMVAHNWEELRRTMWNYVGVARSDERLARARRRIEWIAGETEDYYRRHAVSRDFLELRNLVQCAELIVEGALSRRESRGLHFNRDCPNLRDQAEDTVLSRRDFDRRRSALNASCPFSGLPIAANALADYEGRVAGFCNPQCRDEFAAAAAGGFAGAAPAMLEARDSFRGMIGARTH